MAAVQLPFPKGEDRVAGVWRPKFFFNELSMSNSFSA